MMSQQEYNEVQKCTDLFEEVELKLKFIERFILCIEDDE